MDFHDGAQPADHRAAARMLTALPRRLAHLAERDLGEGPFFIVPIREVCTSRAVVSALAAYPGVAVPTLHGWTCDSLFDTVSLHAVPAVVHDLLWDFNGRTDLRIYTDGTELDPTPAPPTPDRFAAAVLAQLRHPHRAGSDQLTDAAARAIDRIGLAAVCQLLMAWPPVHDGELLQVADALDNVSA